MVAGAGVGIGARAGMGVGVGMGVGAGAGGSAPVGAFREQAANAPTAPARARTPSAGRLLKGVPP